MRPTTISITPPQPDGMAAIGIGVIAVIVAIAWVVLFSCGHSRRAFMLAVMAILVMAISAFAASVGIVREISVGSLRGFDYTLVCQSIH